LRDVIDTVECQGPAGECYSWRSGLPYLSRDLSCWGPPENKESKWPPQFWRRQALEAFRDWTQKAKPFGAPEYTGSAERFWAEIHKVIPRAQTSRQITGGVRIVSIALADLQNNFEKYLRGEVVV
jgi:hypothetical protein